MTDQADPAVTPPPPPPVEAQEQKLAPVVQAESLFKSIKELSLEEVCREEDVVLRPRRTAKLSFLDEDDKPCIEIYVTEIGLGDVRAATQAISKIIKIMRSKGFLPDPEATEEDKAKASPNFLEVLGEAVEEIYEDLQTLLTTSCYSVWSKEPKERKKFDPTLLEDFSLGMIAVLLRMIFRLNWETGLLKKVLISLNVIQEQKT